MSQIIKSQPAIDHGVKVAQRVKAKTWRETAKQLAVSFRLCILSRF